MRAQNLLLMGLAALILSASAANAGFQLLTARQVCWLSVGDEPKVLSTAEKTRCDVNGIYFRPIGVRNPTNESINITLIPKGSLANSIRLEETNFLLQPNGTKYVDFELAIPGSGSYQLDILVKPENLSARSAYAGLSSEIIVYAKNAPKNESNNESVPEDMKTGTDGKPNERIIAAAVTLISIILLLKFYLLKR